MKAQQQLDAALGLIKRGQLEDAREALLKLASSHGKTAAVFAKLGSVEWDMGRLRDAIGHFREATRLAPQSEAASLGLFHCLWEDDQQEAALDEIKRFQSVADSEDYRKIIREINAAT